jgi:hypothetical protein
MDGGCQVERTNGTLSTLEKPNGPLSLISSNSLWVGLVQFISLSGLSELVIADTRTAGKIFDTDFVDIETVPYTYVAPDRTTEEISGEAYLEDIPDTSASERPTSTIIETSDDVEAKLWTVVRILMTHLHVQWHLPFQGANLMLQVLGKALTDIGQLSYDFEYDQTLRRALQYLDLEDGFCIFQMCNECRRIFTETPNAPKCPSCKSDIFVSKTVQMKKRRSDGSRVTRLLREPKLQFPFRSLLKQLELLLAMEDMERWMDAWRDTVHSNDVYSDISDGNIWKTIKAPDGSPFFDNRLWRAASDELRIALVLTYDGQVFISRFMQLPC